MFELQYFILGIVQGFTEFLPISSSGHLVLVSELTDWQDQGLFTDVAVHVGTLLAVIIYLRNHIFSLFRNILTFKISNNENFINIIIATLPAVIVGYFIFDFVQNYFRDLKVVAITSIIFAALLFFADHFKIKISKWENMTYIQAFIIGLFQVLSLIPGVSRSGITISAARILKFKRYDAAKISFLLSIPTLGAVSIFGLKSIIYTQNLGVTSLNFFAIIISYIFSFLTIKYFLEYLKKFSLNIFVIYRLFLGIILLTLSYL